MNRKKYEWEFTNVSRMKCIKVKYFFIRIRSGIRPFSSSCAKVPQDNLIRVGWDLCWCWISFSSQLHFFIIKCEYKWSWFTTLVQVWARWCYSKLVIKRILYEKLKLIITDIFFTLVFSIFFSLFLFSHFFLKHYLLQLHPFEAYDTFPFYTQFASYFMIIFKNN